MSTRCVPACNNGHNTWALSGMNRNMSEIFVLENVFNYDTFVLTPTVTVRSRKEPWCQLLNSSIDLVIARNPSVFLTLRLRWQKCAKRLSWLQADQQGSTSTLASRTRNRIQLSSLVAPRDQSKTYLAEGAGWLWHAFDLLAQPSRRPTRLWLIIT